MQKSYETKTMKFLKLDIFKKCGIDQFMHCKAKAIKATGALRPCNS